MRYKQTDEHKLSHFTLKAILNTILKRENIGQIYHKHKIREKLNCDMTKRRNKISGKKHPNSYKELFLIPHFK